MNYDCIVLGVGGFGSGALDHLARRGARVLGIERFGVPHDRGSSHGETRIIRKAYFEHPDYVPLLLRAYELWRELEMDAARTLYHQSGLLLVGPPNGTTIEGARLAAKLHGIPLEEVARDEAGRRFPQFRVPGCMQVLFEPEAGYLDVEACVRAHVDRAVRNGASLALGETVFEWESDGSSVRVRTDNGEYAAGRLVVTAGAWAGQILADLRLPLRVLRKTATWHEVPDQSYRQKSGMPAWFFDMPAGCFYGFPSVDGRTLKVAEHSGGEEVADPLTVDRALRAADTEPIAGFLHEVLPAVAPSPSRHSVCLYTLTPDHHFIVDRHPRHENVIIAAGFSGHGFKFTGVLGAALADFALDGRTDLPIGFLGLRRFVEVRTEAHTLHSESVDETPAAGDQRSPA